MTASRRYWLKRIASEFRLPIRDVVRHAYGQTAEDLVRWYSRRKA